MENHHYLYLHGFASSPNSSKAQYFQQCFAQQHIQLLIPNLNQENFSALTLTRQLQQVENILVAIATPVTLIGSSLGGLTAAWLAQRHSQVQRLILLAPAFEFLQHWLPTLPAEQVRTWQETGYLLVYHYGEGRQRRLHYQFVEDLRRYPLQQLQPSVPTLILHGCNDQVIPLEESRRYAHRPKVELVELPSDHALGDVKAQMWQIMSTWLSLVPQ